MEDKYKVDYWKLEIPKLGKDELITAWECLKLLMIWMFLFFTPIIIFILLINYIGGLN